MGVLFGPMLLLVFKVKVRSMRNMRGRRRGWTYWLKRGGEMLVPGQIRLLGRMGKRLDGRLQDKTSGVSDWQNIRARGKEFITSMGLAMKVRVTPGMVGRYPCGGRAYTQRRIHQHIERSGRTTFG